MQKVQLTCQQCGKVFLRYPSQAKDGRGKYCSHSCSSKATLRPEVIEKIRVKTKEWASLVWQRRREKYGKSGLSKKGLEKIRELGKKSKSMLGKHHTKETSLKISETAKKHYAEGSHEHWSQDPVKRVGILKKMSEWQVGKPKPWLIGRTFEVSDEIRKRISESKRGTHPSRAEHSNLILNEEREVWEKRGFFYLPLVRLIPDALVIDWNNRTIQAIEVEHGTWSGNAKGRYKRYNGEKQYADVIHAVYRHGIREEVPYERLKELINLRKRL